MEQILAFFRKLYDRYLELSQGKKVAVWALLAAGFSSLAVMLLWVRTPDYQLLYANLTDEDAAAIVDWVKQQKIPYELANAGHTIRVPADKAYEIRLQLAGEGLPEGGDVGLEIFDKNTLGMTEFIQKLNFQRALQGELSRTIKTLDAIEQARVHLVIPEEAIFLRDKPKGKASVMVKVKAGKSLTERQVQGIVHLVSSSVKGISPEDVAVVDYRGAVLSGGKQATAEAMTISTNYQHKRNLEKELETNIKKMLENALGEGKILARVSADLDFEKTESREEIFDPDSQVVRSEQRTTEQTTGSVPPGGLVGVQAQVPPRQAGGGGPGSPASKNKEKETLNYEINKVIKTVMKPMGEIKKLSIAVIIDGTYPKDTGEYQPRPPEEMAKYLDIVKSAVGYDEKRGDRIQVENVQFDRSFIREQEENMAKAERMSLIFEIVKYVLGLVFILLFFSRVIRPMVTWMTTTVEVVPETPAQIEAPEEDQAKIEVERLHKAQTEAQNVRQAVNEFAEGDAQFTAGVIRKWMKEKRSPQEM